MCICTIGCAHVCLRSQVVADVVLLTPKPRHSHMPNPCDPHRSATSHQARASMCACSSAMTAAAQRQRTRGWQCLMRLHRCDRAASRSRSFRAPCPKYAHACSCTVMCCHSCCVPLTNVGTERSRGRESVCVTHARTHTHTHTYTHIHTHTHTHKCMHCSLCTAFPCTPQPCGPMPLLWTDAEVARVRVQLPVFPFRVSDVHASAAHVVGCDWLLFSPAPKPTLRALAPSCVQVIFPHCGFPFKASANLEVCVPLSNGVRSSPVHAFVSTVSAFTQPQTLLLCRPRIARGDSGRRTPSPQQRCSSHPPQPPVTNRHRLRSPRILRRRQAANNTCCISTETSSHWSNGELRSERMSEGVCE